MIITCPNCKMQIEEGIYQSTIFGYSCPICGFQINKQLGTLEKLIL